MIRIKTLIKPQVVLRRRTVKDSQQSENHSVKCLNRLETACMITENNNQPYGPSYLRSSGKTSECEILSIISRPTSSLTGISRPQTSIGGGGE